MTKRQRLIAGLLAVLGIVFHTPAFADGCPIRFEATVPTTDQPPSYPDLLNAWGKANSEYGSIRLLHPRERGLFIIRSETIDAGAVFGNYSTDDPGKTKSFNLKIGLAGGVEWRTVADSRQADVARVEPGDYRLVIRYLAPGSPTDGDDVVVCVAISPSFRVAAPFYLHRFE